jgi:hypothetical protein
MGIDLIREIEEKDKTISRYYLLETTCLRVREYEKRTIVDIFYSEKTSRVSPLIMHILNKTPVSESDLSPNENFKKPEQIYFKKGYKINKFQQTQLYGRKIAGVGGLVVGGGLGFIAGVLGLLPLALFEYAAAVPAVLTVPTAIGAAFGVFGGIKSRYWHCNTKYLTQKLLDFKKSKENQIFFTNQMNNLEGIIQVELSGKSQERLKRILPNAA